MRYLYFIWTRSYIDCIFNYGFTYIPLSLLYNTDLTTSLHFDIVHLCIYDKLSSCKMGQPVVG